jgi:hypothetical protein
VLNVRSFFILFPFYSERLISAFSDNIGNQEEHCQWQKSKGKSAVIVTSCSGRTLAMLPVRNIVANPNAAKPVKQLASSVGCKNPRTKTTFADLKTSYEFSSGARPTLDTGAKRKKTSKMRYKIP